MTPAALLIRLSGLSHKEAADCLNVRLDTVASWFRKTNPNLAKPGVLNELRELIAKQERAASETVVQVTKEDLTKIKLGYPADDYEAQSLGWPCVGAWAAMAGRVIAQVDVPVVLVPLGQFYDFANGL